MSAAATAQWWCECSRDAGNNEWGDLGDESPTTVARLNRGAEAIRTANYRFGARAARVRELHAEHHDHHKNMRLLSHVQTLYTSNILELD